MRKFMTYAVATIAILALGVTAQAADQPHPQKPGKWQMKFQMEMPNMPVTIPPITTEICLTEEDLKDPQKSVPNDPKSKCTVSDVKIDGKTVTWNIDCPKQNMKGNGEVTYGDDKYTGWLKMTVNDQEMTTKYSGKWLGTCTK